MVIKVTLKDGTEFLCQKIVLIETLCCLYVPVGMYDWEEVAMFNSSNIQNIEIEDVSNA